MVESCLMQCQQLSSVATKQTLTWQSIHRQVHYDFSYTAPEAKTEHFAGSLPVSLCYLIQQVRKVYFFFPSFFSFGDCKVFIHLNVTLVSVSAQEIDLAK